MPESVPANIRYLSPEWRGRTERPAISSKETRRANTRFYAITVEDARPLQRRGELELDRQGFQLVDHQPEVQNFHDPEQVRRGYYPGIRALVGKLTDAAAVEILHHVIRTEAAGSFNNAYARYVHFDFSQTRARDMSRNLMVERGVCAQGETDQYDFAWYNTWQPIEREVRRNPLTVIDARSIEDQDVIEYTFGESSTDGVASLPFYSKGHRHYYFPRMQTDELLVLKQLDTRPGRSRRCAHTSFDDNTSGADALPRRSIEVRMMCVFPRSARS